MATFGYARVSTREQDYAAQVAELMAAGAAKVYREKASGAQADNRAELMKLIGRLEANDVLLVTRLDRLARSTRDLLNIIDGISQRGASFKSLRETWADTSNAHGRLMLTIFRRSRRVRARADQGPMWRGHQRRQGSRRSFWPAAQAVAVSARRGIATSYGG